MNKAISGFAPLGEDPDQDLGVIAKNVVCILQVIPSISTCDGMMLPVGRDGVQEDRLGDVPGPGVCHERLPTDGHCSSSHLAGVGSSPFSSIEVISALLCLAEGQPVIWPDVKSRRHTPKEENIH